MTDFAGVQESGNHVFDVSWKLPTVLDFKNKRRQIEPHSARIPHF